MKTSLTINLQDLRSISSLVNTILSEDAKWTPITIEHTIQPGGYDISVTLDVEVNGIRGSFTTSIIGRDI